MKTKTQTQHKHHERGRKKGMEYSETLGWMQMGLGSASVTLNGHVHHYAPITDGSDPSCGLSFFLVDNARSLSAAAIMLTSQYCIPWEKG